PAEGHPRPDAPADHRPGQGPGPPGEGRGAVRRDPEPVHLRHGRGEPGGLAAVHEVKGMASIAELISRSLVRGSLHVGAEPNPVSAVASRWLDADREFNAWFLA